MPILDALLSQGSIPFAIGSAIFLLTINTYLNYRRAISSIHDHPGIRSIFPAQGLIANILPHIPGVAMGRHWGMRLKHTIFAETGWDVITAIGLYPRVSVCIILADPLAIKEVTTSRSHFPKPIEDYGILTSYGKNIVITEGDEWKRHRKVAAPVFSERNNKFVWDESIRMMTDMFKNWGTHTPEVVINHIPDITIPIALFVISVAGFGLRISWEEDKQIPTGHKLSFKDAIRTVSTYALVRLLVPKWVYPFSKFLGHIQLAFDELAERFDLFSALLDASESEDDDATLTDQELIGNIFMFLIAGHETTAHTLCFCFGLLALEQDEQEKMYQQITSVLPNGEDPSYENMNMLTYPLAVFYETLRLFPPVNHIPKSCAEDTTIPAVRPDGTKGQIPVPKGAKIYINTCGLHFNPRYWPDPEAFKPSRFLGDWPKDAFLPFSAGPRACLGRRFSETEAVAALTMLVSRYKIEVKNPELYEGLTHAQKRARLLMNRPGLSLTPLSVPLIFKKR